MSALDDLDRGTLRRLSGLRPERGRVLSVYLNLDPSDFATPAARASAITSVLDEASRLVRENGGEHDVEAALREDLERVRRFLESDFTPKRAGAVALFACSPANLWEALRLPRPVGSEVVVDDTPWVEPLARLGGPERLCLALVNRRSARVLQGTRERVQEVEVVEDDVHGWHDQGGWSQPRYQRGIEKEIHDHLIRTAGILWQRSRRRPFDRLAVGATPELWPSFEERLHPYVRERVVGRFDVDVENVSPTDALEAARGVLEEADRRREAEALSRLEQGLGPTGRAEPGLDAVLGALNERRVETLLYDEGLRASGVSCPDCGWLGAGGETCPLDGAALDRRESVVEEAIEAAVLQSAVVLALPGSLGPHGGIAALLRW